MWTLFHSYAFDFSVWELWGPLLHGGRLVVVPFEVSRSAGEFLGLLAREGVTVLNQTPSAFYQLMQADRDDPVTGMNWRCAMWCSVARHWIWVGSRRGTSGGVRVVRPW
ncbi:protein of unknown function [Streptomyces murinus]